MPNVIKLVTSSETLETPRMPFSFDITQTDQRGMVLLDACVPLVMATAFLQMLIAFQEASTS